MDTIKALEPVENLISHYMDELPKCSKTMLKSTHESFSTFRKNESE